MCLSNGIYSSEYCARELLKSQKTRQTFESAMKKKFLVLGFGFFVSDVISGIVLDLFDPLHLALGPTC